MLTKRAVITAELRGPLLVLLIAIPALAFGCWRVNAAVAGASSYQREIRVAQIARAKVLRFVLDEETGMRGYAATGDPLFLEPYKKARSQFAGAVTGLRAAFAPLAVDDILGVVEDEVRQHATWEATVGSRLIANPSRSPTTDELQRRGKQIVDNIRNDDQQLASLLDDAATAADERSQTAITATLMLSLGALTLITLSAGVFGFLQARAARETFEARVLYENQKRIADALQTAFLSKELPASPALGLHATYVPATAEAQVGGDWYDAFELPDKRILFSVGDVAGHGLEAAVVMSRARQAIITSALHADDPAIVLELANAAILLQETRMVTAICGYIDPVTREVTYATAGHPPPILARPGQPAELLPHDGIPLGIFADTKYTPFVAHAVDGALLVLYTDGIVEHKRNVLEGQARLLDAVQRAVDEENPAHAIYRTIFQAGTAADDIAILTVKFRETTNSTRGAALVGGLQLNRIDLPLPEGAMRPNEPVTAAPPSESPGEAGRVLRELVRSRLVHSDH